jgi:hypothetical protein
MRRDKRFYLVEEDIRYYQDMFNNCLNPGVAPVADPDVIAEFFRYADYVEKEFSYRIHVMNFPQVFTTKLINI